MGHQFTIEGDEAVRLATELATITGKSVEDAVLSALRIRLAEEQKLKEEMARILLLVKAFQDTLQKPWPSSDHSFLYDNETGLPA